MGMCRHTKSPRTLMKSSIMSKMGKSRNASINILFIDMEVNSQRNVKGLESS